MDCETQVEYDEGVFMTENPKEYIITEDEWQSLKSLHLDLATNGSKSDAWLIMENIHSRQVSTPPVPDSTRLIEMAKRAHTEWKNREERRGIHNEIDWCCGWIAGFLSVDKPDWSKEHDVAIRQDEREKVLTQFADLIHNESVRLSPAMVDMVYSYRVAQIITTYRNSKQERAP